MMNKAIPGDIRIPAPALHDYVRAIFERAGAVPRDAALIADHLVRANLTGHDSHGVGMIPTYIQAIDESALVLTGKAEVVRDFGAVLTIEGHNGPGQVVAFEAMERGIERARQLGVAAVGLRNAHHIGRIGHWAEQCARAGFVSFHFVSVAGDALVAPFGGIDRRFGTNPFCAAFPRVGKTPLLLDFATSGIAFGKTRVAYNKGVPVPAGNLIDHAGVPTCNPAVMHEAPLGSLVAFGGHKGSGMAAMCEILAGALSGGVTTHSSTLRKGRGIVNCMTSVILDPRAFDAPDAQAEAAAFVEWVQASRIVDGAEGTPIQMPGEPESVQEAARTADGIPVDATTWQQIHDAALQIGIAAADVDMFRSKAL